MEADWSVELASGDPVIVVPWGEYGSELDSSGPPQLRFINLRSDSSKIDQLPEVHVEPALRAALLALNDPASPWWTAKCGLWDSSLDEDEIDPYEMDADPEDAVFASGGYIDLLPSDPAAGGAFRAIECRARSLAYRMRSVPLRCARVDFIVRLSDIEGTSGFAITWFFAACRATPKDARLRRAEAVTRTLPSILDVAAIASAAFAEGRYNGKSVGE